MIMHMCFACSVLIILHPSLEQVFYASQLPIMCVPIEEIHILKSLFECVVCIKHDIIDVVIIFDCKGFISRNGFFCEIKVSLVFCGYAYISC